MSKDQATFQVHCLLQEIYFLNDAVINGDLTSKTACKRAQDWADEMKTHLLKLDRLTEAWVVASISYGGLVTISWEIKWDDGDCSRGNQTPVRQ